MRKIDMTFLLAVSWLNLIGSNSLAAPAVVPSSPAVVSSAPAVAQSAPPPTAPSSAGQVDAQSLIPSAPMFDMDSLSPAAPGTIKRSDSLSFDVDLIEGMNSNPFEALTHLDKQSDRDQGHLYHRKSNFRREIRQTAQEMGYSQ